MGNLSNAVKVKIRKSESVNVCDLDFYPITMANYEEFCSCKNALTLRQSSFPVEFMSMDYLSAIYAMDLKAITKGGQKNFIGFACIIRLMFLSLRIDENEFDFTKNVKTVDGNLSKLDYLEFYQNGKISKVTPRDFSTKIRPIIAGLNGLSLPDETDNLDLVEGKEERQKLMSNGVKLNANIDDLIASVAYQSHTTEREVNDWTIREFENRRKAIERDKNYTIAHSGMVTFKGDTNPYPSWCFDKVDNSLGTVSLAEIGKNLQGVSEK